MDLNFSHNLILKHLIIATGLLLSLPSVMAENKMYIAASDEKSISNDNDDTGLEKTLEHNFSPEDRARLRKALSDYAKTQIQNTRKLKINVRR